MIDIKKINNYIEVKEIGIVNQYSKNAFGNTTDYYIIDKLFYNLIQEKNITVANHISEKIVDTLNQEFDSQKTIDYFKNYVLSYDPNKQPEKPKPWWKLW